MDGLSICARRGLWDYSGAFTKGGIGECRDRGRAETCSESVRDCEKDEARGVNEAGARRASEPESPDGCLAREAMRV